jgi:hypothetical protein
MPCFLSLWLLNDNIDASRNRIGTVLNQLAMFKCELVHFLGGRDALAWPLQTFPPVWTTRQSRQATSSAWRLCLILRARWPTLMTIGLTAKCKSPVLASADVMPLLLSGNSRLRQILIVAGVTFLSRSN